MLKPHETALKRQLFTPIVASSWAIMDSTLPLTLASEIEAIPGVDEAILWGIPFGMDCINYEQYQVVPSFLQESESDGQVSLIIAPADLVGLFRLGLLGGLHRGACGCTGPAHWGHPETQ